MTLEKEDFEYITHMRNTVIYRTRKLTKRRIKKALDRDYEGFFSIEVWSSDQLKEIRKILKY